MKLCEKKNKPSAIRFFVAVFLLSATMPFLDLSAQSCPVKISNNLIQLKSPVCVNTLGFFEGSSPSGGDGTYRYQWEASDGNCGENEFKTINGATGKDYVIPANADPDACYRRIVMSGDCKDESNKLKLNSSNLTPPQPPTTIIVQPTCISQTGSITVTNPAPSQGISYSIDGLTYTNTSGIFAGLSPKIYTVSVQYSSGCISPVKLDTIKAVQPPTGSITPATATVCGSGGSGVSLSVSGGTSYQWYRDGVALAGATQASYTATQSGSYTADIVSGTCTGKASNAAVVAKSPAINFALTITDPNCTSSSGTISVDTPSGGSGSGFVFSKDEGVTFQKENIFQNLNPGTYRIVVKDSKGCESEAKTATIKPFTSTLKAAVSVIDILCSLSVGSATISASGGTAPYQYKVDGGAFQLEKAFPGLSAGSHQLIVKDAKGCSYETSFAVVQIKSTLAATATVTNAACDKKGAAEIRATGGAAPYVFRLDSSNFQSSASFANLAAGKHQVTVKDNLGCSVDVSFEIKQSGNSPNLVINNPPALCPGTTQNLQDHAIVNGSGQDLVYTFWREAGATTAIANPGAVAAGTYYIKATSKEGCFEVKPVVVTLRTVTPGRITASGPTIICSDQSVTLTASAGSAYQWYRNDTAIAGATDSRFITSLSGVYAVRISDGTCAVLAANTIQVQYSGCIPAPGTSVFVPSAFTPNKNGANDLLRPLLYNVNSLGYFKVFNRWGQLVFQTNTIGRGWDGTINGVQQPTETYTWILECTDNNGKVIKQSGRSLLLR